MMRLFFKAGVVGGWLAIAGIPAVEAQESATGPGAEAAASVVQSILSGRDDPATWGALAAALGTGLPGAPGGPATSAVEPPSDAVGGLSLPAGAGWLPTWMRSSQARRVAAGAVAGLFALLLALTGWQSMQMVERAYRAIARRDRRRRTLVMRAHPNRPRARDAERLRAQLGARGAT